MPVLFTRMVCGILITAAIPAAVADADDEADPPAQPATAEQGPDDGNVRLLLLAPTGPVVIEARITVNGRPFAAAREQFIDEVLAGADTNGDGEGTWLEAIENPRLAFGRLGWRLRNARLRFLLMNTCDRNGDGKVDRAEARLLMEAEGEGPSFRLQEFRKTGRDSGLLQLFDVNRDKSLSPDELKQALALLQRRDVNNNDWLETEELPFVEKDWAKRNRFQRTTGLAPAESKQVQTLLDLRPRVDLAAVDQLLRNVYGRKIEVAPYLTATPQISLKVTLGERDQPGRGVAVAALAAGLKSKVVAGPNDTEVTEIDLSGTKLRLALGAVNREPPDFDDMAKREMELRDDDGNGILNDTELDSLPNTTLAQMYGRWDADGDGRVSLAVIKSDLKREHAVRWSQAEVATATDFPTMLEILDVDGNRKLSLREMREARQRILEFDANGDGTIGVEERHGIITIVFSRAQERYSHDIFNTLRTRQLKGRSQDRPAPVWFQRMDRNEDNDLSRREFLGTTESFRRIDRDSDGLIDPDEAEKAGVSD